MIDEYFLDPNQSTFGDNQRGGIEGIDRSLGYEAEKEKAQKVFDQRFLLAQKPMGRKFSSGVMEPGGASFHGLPFGLSLLFYVL